MIRLRLPARGARRRGPGGDEAAQTVTVLAGLLQSGLTPAQAIQEWPQRAPPSLRAATEASARRIRLGASPAAAVQALCGALGPEAATLSALLAVHGRLGGDAALMVEMVASACAGRASARLEAASASAGAKLSARMVAGLPLAFVPLTPLSSNQLTDPTGLVAVVLGVALAAVGLIWTARLVPQAPPPDATSLVADALAAVVAGGTSPNAALEVICGHAPPEVRVGLRVARRLVRLGAAWPAALRRCGSDGLAELGSVLERSCALGIPVADALSAFARERRSRQAAVFRKRLRRAPVLMTLPLTLCVLPAFMLLAVTPLARGLVT